MKRYPSILATSVLTSLVVLCGAGAAAAAEEEPHLLSREYHSGLLSYRALEALLWDACPEGAPGCAVYDTRIENGQMRLVAPPSVHRAVTRRLAELEAAGDSHRLRLDLVAAQAGASDDLGGLPAAVRSALDPLRPQLAGRGLVHLDSALVTTRDEAGLNLTNGEHSFRIDLNLHDRREGIPLDVRLRHLNPGPEGSLGGNLLATTLTLTPALPTIAGTTHYATDGPELILLVTADP
jgi:hypothetical protein